MNPVRYEVVNDSIDNKQQQPQPPQSQQLRLQYVVCERTKLVGDTMGSQQAIGTGVYEKIKADLCLVSIGYKGLPLDADDDDSCTVMKKHFDSSKGILRNNHGRVNVNDTDTDTAMAPIYVSGWLKRGPSGIIGTNIVDAKDTVQSIIQDMSIQINNNNNNSTDNDNKIDTKDSNNGITTSTTTITTPSASSSLEDVLKERNVDYVTWDGYRNIDYCESYGSSSSSSSSGDVDVDVDDDNHNMEQERDYHHKRHPDQPREKITCWEKLIQVANNNILSK